MLRNCSCWRRLANCLREGLQLAIEGNRNHAYHIRHSISAVYAPGLSVLILASLFLTVSRLSYSYEAGEHVDIGNQAKQLYLANAAVNHWTGASALEHSYCWGRIEYMLVEEDNLFDMYYLEHFWDPVTGDGLWGYDSAYVRAQGLWDTTLFQAYRSGDIDVAYETLGRIAHLVSDMGVPAHVQLDPHPPLVDPDWYEHTYIANSVHHPIATTSDISAESTLFALMHTLATATDAFATEDDYHGTQYTSWELFDYDEYGEFLGAKPNTGSMIAAVSYRGSVGAVVGLFRLFFSIAQPTVASLYPTNEVTSGLLFTIFELNASGYMGLTCERGALYYSTAVSLPDPWDHSAWLLVNEELGASPYFFLWAPGDLNHRVWLRGRVWDSLHCDSAPVVSGWMDIDSTRPEIRNVTITYE